MKETPIIFYGKDDVPPFKYKNPTANAVGFCMVGVTRFELATSWSRTKRTTKLCHTPLLLTSLNSISYQSCFVKSFL